MFMMAIGSCFIIQVVTFVIVPCCSTIETLYLNTFKLRMKNHVNLDSDIKTTTLPILRPVWYWTMRHMECRLLTTSRKQSITCETNGSIVLMFAWFWSNSSTWHWPFYKWARWRCWMVLWPWHIYRYRPAHVSQITDVDIDATMHVL